MSRVRVAIICDMLEEGWTSMDITGDLLLEHLRTDHGSMFDATRVRFPMRRRLTRPSVYTGKRFNAERLVNRFWDYPRALRVARGQFDLFHIVDHSYAQLVHALPAERTVVTCHDVDTFRSILEPDRVRKSWAFRAMTRRVMNGLRRAAYVTCDSEATRAELLMHRLLPPERTTVAYLGVYPGCTPDPDPEVDAEAARIVPQRPNAIELLHVGSTIPRKRIDVLLRVFAEVRRRVPNVHLVRIGGEFTPAQAALVQELGIDPDAVTVRSHVHRSILLALYRRAALVLQPSDAEGFGLPVAEALACGTLVVASNLPVLREVGGSAAVYRPVGDIDGWTDAVVDLLRQRAVCPAEWSGRSMAAVQHASQFSWRRFASTCADVYTKVLNS